MHHLRVWNRALTGTGQVLRDSTGRHDGTIGSSSMVEPDDALRDPI
jgi:hypothetical protein